MFPGPSNSVSARSSWLGCKHASPCGAVSMVQKPGIIFVLVLTLVVVRQNEPLVPDMSSLLSMQKLTSETRGRRPGMGSVQFVVTEITKAPLPRSVMAQGARVKVDSRTLFCIGAEGFNHKPLPHDQMPLCSPRLYRRTGRISPSDLCWLIRGNV